MNWNILLLTFISFFSFFFLSVAKKSNHALQDIDDLSSFVSSSDGDYVAVVFYRQKNLKNSKLMSQLESWNLPGQLPDVIFGKTSDEVEALEYGLDVGSLPGLILFEDGIPKKYSGNMENKAVFEWINDEMHDDDDDDGLETLDASSLEKVVRFGKTLLVFFVRDTTKKVPSEDDLRNVCQRLDIDMVKVEGRREVNAKYGIDSIPAILYFEKAIPTMYDDQIESTETLIEWIEMQRTSDTIEQISEEILKTLIDDLEYLAVFFTGPCDDKRGATDQECERVLKELEKIDDELDSFGITLVTTEDIKFAGNRLKIRKFPALGIFRNGDFKLYDEGPLKNERDLLNWLIDGDTLEIPGRIEEIGETMLFRIIETEPDVVVFLYDDDDDDNDDVDEDERKKKTNEILKTLERVDDLLDKHNIEFFKCSDPKIEEKFGFFSPLPMLIYVENGIPVAFDGTDFKNDKEIYAWAMEQYETNEIPTVDLPVLEKLLDRIDDLVVLFYDPTKRTHRTFIEDIETTDDDAEKMDVFMVKVGDVTIAKHFGLYALPAIIFYEDGDPNVYDDPDLSSERVLEWITDEKLESTISKVTVPILESMIKTEEYMAVLILSDCDRNEEGCDKTLKRLEELDDELDKIGIPFVYVSDDNDETISKLKLSTIPAILLYRNGEKTVYEGSIDNEMGVLKFLTDIENLVLPDRIEDVNIKTLNYFLSERSNVFAFLYDESDKSAKRRSDEIIKVLESIDDEMEDENQVLFVKCSDPGVDREYGIGYLPRLVYFRDRIPEPFEGEEMNPEEVLSWMRTELEKGANEIKSVTRPILEKLIEKEDHIAAVFIDEDNNAEMKIIKELETLDLRKDDLIVVTLDDREWAEELGLSDPPTLVHFTGDIPSVYRGKETSKDIVYWLEEMKTEHVIEDVTDEILDNLIEDQDYVAILFKGKDSCHSESCRTMMENLETIDDELNDVGIAFVQLDDDEDYPFLHHSIDTFPAIGLYRNGNFKQYEEVEFDDSRILQWFLDERNLYMDDRIEKVNSQMLSYIYENNDNFVVFFYDSNDRDSDDIIRELEKVDEVLTEHNVSFVMINEDGVGDAYGITDLPALAYVQSGIPNIYDKEDLMNEDAVLQWVLEEVKTTRILEVTSILYEKLLEKFTNLVVIFFDMEEDPTVTNLESIAESCRNNDIAVIKINDEKEIAEHGLNDMEMPQILFYHKRIPTLMRNVDLEDPEEVEEWILKRQSMTLIEEVTDEILTQLIEDNEYVAVYFRGGCNDDNVDCEAVLAELETIDDDLDATGILLVTTSDTGVALDNGVKNLPAIGLFRNGYFVAYEGDESNEKAIFKWMTNEETLKIIGIIDEVNMAMLNTILQDEDDAFVFFYESNNTDAHAILEELEYIDEKLDQQDLTMVKISHPGASKAFGIDTIPSLVYFENGIPEVFEGDLLNDITVMKWMKDVLAAEMIKEITVPMLDMLVEKQSLAVVFYDPNDETDSNDRFMEDLEDITEECQKYEISTVKISDTSEAREYGIDQLPGLLYFENRIPSLFDGNLEDKKEVVDWLIQQKMTDTIEEVTEEILERLIEDEEYLAVFFSGPCEDDDPCDDMLEDLERIDTTLGESGIMLVTTEERDLAKQYEVRSFPALGLFRNQEYLPFEGDLEEEMDILEWITDRTTLEIPGKIESVNPGILDFLLRTETDVIVYLYREDNLQDERILRSHLEVIDDTLEERRIPFVKCSKKGIEKRFGLSGPLPFLVHFHSYVPNIYKHNLENDDNVLNWISESISKNEIEEVNGPILDVLIEKLDNLAVIFVDETCDTFLEGMEQMDDELEQISVALVKVDDATKALEFGIDDFPKIIYFKQQVPGLYDGDLANFKNIFSWLSSRKKGNFIQLVTDDILEDVVDHFLFVAVLFQGSCKSDNDECNTKLQETITAVEDINDDLEDIGIRCVTTKQKKLAKSKYGVLSFPALGLFRNGKHFLLYEDDVTNEAKILHWMSDTSNYEVSGEIEVVNPDLLEHIIESEDDVLVLFYEADDPDLDEILEPLSEIEDILDHDGVEFVMIPNTDRRVLDYYGLTLIPSLVYFQHGVPSVYMGDIRNDNNVLGWITKALRVQEIIKVDPFILDSLLERNDHVAVLYYDDDTPHFSRTLKILEEIDGDCQDNDIDFVRISNSKTLNELGVEVSIYPPPILVYYQNEIPNLYPNHPITSSEPVLRWLIEQRNTASIETVTDAMLNDIIDEHEYVAVLFLGLCTDDNDDDDTNNECRKVIRELEKIDHVLEEYGIVFVQTSDLEKAKEHWISKFPSLALYRNGEYVKYGGIDLTREETVLQWITSERTLSIPGKIEKVNELMLAKMLNDPKHDNFFVFFYEEGDVFAEKILRKLEELDSQLEANGVDFVKISEENVEEDFDLDNLPALVHFKDGIASEFYGDLRQNDIIVQWIDNETEEKRNKPQSKKKKKKKN